MSSRQVYRNLEAIEKIIDRLESVERFIDDEIFGRVIKPGLYFTNEVRKTIIRKK